MPDITMCTNDTCKAVEYCYRRTARPSKYQSYARFEPTEKGCTHFEANALVHIGGHWPNWVDPFTGEVRYDD